ncbi:MAG: hypothetical protein Q7T79_00915 [bacterium]|nr:hypothetical protein [bacterium]
MSIEWQNIKSFNDSQNNAFEELICQLAREEPIVDKKEFYRIAAPDGGVEAYCVLESGEEYGWQAKYFSSMGSSQWSQLKDSFETALRTHPNLTKYYVCIPLDRQDPRRNDQSWFMDKWNEKTQEWVKYANDLGRSITFEYWGSSELIHRLSEEKHAGRKLFWFSKEEFSDKWFQSHIKNSIYNLGHRYTPALNFELDIAKHFDALSRNDRFRDYFKNRLHSFLKDFKSLDKEFLDQDAAKNLINLLDREFEISKKSELLCFDIEAIQKDCKLVINSLHEYQNTLKSQESELSKDTFNYKNFKIKNAYNAIYEFQEFINEATLILANLPIMLLSGEAGIGKSHLLADIASKKINENKSCVLLLGQHFTSEESPWTQILNNLLRIKCNEKELLGALNARAEAEGERLLFIVDAINEGRGRRFWSNYIKGFINDFSNYPWLSLVLSIRTSYETLLTPKDLIPDNAIIRVVHHGFENVEYQASSFFFSQYGIEQPSIPLLHPEFSNPLFLKLFCEGLKRSGQKRIPKGYGGITSIIDFFLASVDEKLSHPSFFDYQPASGKQLVKKVINALIQHKLQNDLSIIPYDSAVDIANSIVTRYSAKKGFIDNLISEGVLSKNIYWKNNNEDIIYFAYERFEDHLTTAYLLESYLDKSNPEIAFQDQGALAQYVNHIYRYQGIVEALSIQLPEKINKELYELVSDEKKSNRAIVEAFVKSLIWRKPETITEKVKDYVNQQVLVDDYTFDLFFQMVYSVSSDPDHFFNANSLHRFLMKFSLADRDAMWTTYLHHKDDEVSAMQRLMDWALHDCNKNYLSAESRLLACKALAWLFTSTNIGFRGVATKALVCVLENNLPIVTRLLVDFHTVNDPYVYERILAAAYGTVLRSVDLNGLTELSEFILTTVFEKEEVYPNVLVRDYARNIIEYALYKQVFTLTDPQVIRPPYKSQFPNSFPSNEKIDAYKYDYKLNDAKDYWGGNAILRSMVTEYGRGMCSYGDFGRYTFQSALHDWKYKFDPNDLSNYACKIIFETYGYDVKKHGEFDNHASSGDRHTNKKERIGKKYQWLALYEVLARVADNYQMQDGSAGWHDEKKYIWYQGTWEPFVRNIDPTSVYRPGSSSSFKRNESWWDSVEYNDWHGSHQNWLISAENLPNPKEIIELKDTQGNEWLVLETYPSWDDSVPVGYEQHEYPHKHLWYQIRSYFVSSEQAEGLTAWAKQQHLMGRWFPENSDQYHVFSREYYWSPAYRFFDNPYYGRSQWEDVHEKGNYEQTIGEVMVTTERHNWEPGADHREQPSYFAPREYMYEKMLLQYSKNIGEWLNTEGEVVCFDPSVNQEESSCLLIRKDALLRFLDENNLKIFWTCLGEKQILGDSYDRIKYTQWLELSGVFTLNASGVDGVIKPLIKSVGV